MKNSVKKMCKVLFPTLLVAVNSLDVMAGDSAIRLGYDSGGDNIGELQFTDGDSMTFKFGSGAFIEIGYGVETPVAALSNITTEVYVGWKNDGAELSNGKVDYTRYLVGLNQYYQMDKLRLGVGIAYHFKSSFESRGFENFDIKLRNSPGISIISDYQVGKRVKLGARYNSLNYKTDGQTVDGSSLGFFIAVTD